MRDPRAVPWLPIALCLILIVALFPAGDTTFGAFDQIRPMAQAGAPSPDSAWDVLQADSVLQFFVWRDLVFEGYRLGTVPVWNPYALGGTPLLANSQSGALYPLHVLIGVAGVPTALAISVLAILHLLIWGLGLVRLVRTCGGGPVSELFSMVGGIGMFILSWMSLPSVVTTVAWIPWAIVAVLPAREDEARSPGSIAKRAIAVVGALGMMATAGHLQFFAYGLLAVGIAWLTTVVMTRRMDLAVLGGLIVSAGLAYAMLRPVLEYSQFSHRRGSPTPEGYAAYLGSALRGWDLATLTHPGALGNPRVGWLPISDTAKASEYWPALVRTGANSAEGATAIGVLLVAGLIALLVIRKPRDTAGNPGVVALAVILGVAGLLAWGSPLNAALYFGVPGWSATGSPGRVIALLVMAGAVLGALGLERWVSRSAELTRAQSGGLYAGLAVAALWPVLVVRSGLLQWGGPWPGADSPLNRDGLLDTHVSGLAISSLGTGAVAAIALVVAVTIGQKQRTAGHVALAIAAVATWVPHFAFSPAKGAPLERPPMLAELDGRRVAVENANWELLAAAPAGFPPNTLSGFRVAEIGGYDSLLHRDTVAMLNELNGQDSAPPANGNMMFIKPGADRAKLAAAGVTALIRRDAGGFSVEDVPGPGIADVDGTPVRCAYDLRGVRLQLDNPAPGTLTVRFRPIGPWRLTVAGRDVPVETGGRWFTLAIPANAGEVLLTPVPPFPFGLVLAWAVFGLLAAAVGLWPERSAGPDAAPSDDSIAA
ncbi:MAG: hypothetical protein SFX74_12655 [Fimbriimonadaceae bacterium]|nr:hypothetical protein [Fimbriimonadaceae bacterium]